MNIKISEAISKLEEIKKGLTNKFFNDKFNANVDCVLSSVKITTSIANYTYRINIDGEVYCDWDDKPLVSLDINGIQKSGTIREFEDFISYAKEEISYMRSIKADLLLDIFNFYNKN